MLSAVRPECINVVHGFDGLERVRAYILVRRPIMVQIVSETKVLFATLLTFLSSLHYLKEAVFRVMKIFL
jgi:hypothetical protein